MADYTNGGIFGDSSLFEEFESVPLNENSQSKPALHEETPETSLKTKLADLEKENERLKSLLRNLFPPRGLHVQNTECGPIAQVIFMNNDISRKYRQDAEDFFEKLVARGDNTNTRHVSGMIDIDDDDDDDDSSSSAKPQRSSRVIIDDESEIRREAYLATGNVQYYQVFCIDQIGRPLINGNAQLTGWFIPIYTTVFLEALPVDENPQAQRKSRPKNTCWNCDSEDHSLRECPMQRNPARINANKQLFQSQSTPQQKRYVNDGKTSDKAGGNFSQFQPGCISDALREAIGIRDNQLPPYIYMMRVHGYPPGWMREAEVESSGMKVYNIKKNEHGEVKNTEDNDIDQATYDANKLVEYPGFNVPPPKHTKDEWRELGAPPMQKQHSKEVLEGYMTPPEHRGKKRRGGSFMNETEAKKPKSHRDEVDMDLASSGTETSSSSRGWFGDQNTPGGKFKPPLPPTPGTASPLPPLPLSTPPATPQGTQTPSQSSADNTPMPSPGSTVPFDASANVSQESSRSASPSVEDLEKQQQKLMEALIDAGAESNIVSDVPAVMDTDSMEEGEVDSQDDTQKVDQGTQDDSMRPPGTGEHEEDGVEAGEIIESPESPSAGDQGKARTESDAPRTFKLHNPPELFKDLSGDSTPNKSGIPRLSNFASGITPHVDESLAEKTGVFQKLLGILKKKGNKSK